MFGDIDFLSGIDKLDVATLWQRGQMLIRAHEFGKSDSDKSWDSIQLSREQFQQDLEEEEA
jgi:hypothetical protein